MCLPRGHAVSQPQPMAYGSPLATHRSLSAARRRRSPLAEHAGRFRQIQSDFGKQKYGNNQDQLGKDERQDPGVNGTQFDVGCHAFDDEDIHPDWRGNQSQFDHHDNDDAKSDGIESKVDNNGKEDRHGE